MELTGLQIFKYLPAAKKTENSNCKKCGCSTCMAYALKLVKKQANVDSCPYMPQDLRDKLLDAARIQQHEIKLSENLVVGGENVMFRHDRTFVNRTVIAITLDVNDVNFKKTIEKIKSYSAERIGELFKVDAVYCKGVLGQDICEDLAKNNIAVISQNTKYKILTGKNIQELEKTAIDVLEEGHSDIVFNLEYTSDIIEQLVYLRRASVIKRHAPLTYPVMVEIPESYDLMQTCSIASHLICKYANIVVLNKFDEALLSTLMTLRQSIYTNPQKPLQVEAKIYEFNEPDRNAPVLLTTNFALTYFAVASELESLPFGSYLVVTPSDGMSVLTAWSADKFTAELVAKSIKDFELAKKVNTRKIVIPGLLGHMKDELQDVLPEWEIIVGTVEACQIPNFLSQRVVS